LSHKVALSLHQPSSLRQLNRAADLRGGQCRP
jgi:hypothetical protein